MAGLFCWRGGIRLQRVRGGRVAGKMPALQSPLSGCRQDAGALISSGHSPLKTRFLRSFHPLQKFRIGDGQFFTGRLPAVIEQDGPSLWIVKGAGFNLAAERLVHLLNFLHLTPMSGRR